VAKGEVVRQLIVKTAAMSAMALSPDGTRLATGGYQDHVVRVWDVAGGRELQHFDGHTDTVAGLAWSPDGATLASSSWDQTIKLWEVAGPKSVEAVSPSQPTPKAP
jgi:WD40 repeat protein